MPGQYNAGQSPIRAVMVDPTTLEDVSAAGAGSGVTATIANGASLSGALDAGAGSRPVRIDMPAAWTAASLTFQGSNDGVTFRDLYDKTGAEYTVAASANQAIILPLADFIGIRRFKIRSGTAGAPVNQGGARSLFVATQAL